MYVDKASQIDLLASDVFAKTFCSFPNTLSLKHEGAAGVSTPHPYSNRLRVNLKMVLKYEDVQQLSTCYTSCCTVSSTHLLQFVDCCCAGCHGHGLEGKNAPTRAEDSER
jgi:hypothetical protein